MTETQKANSHGGCGCSSKAPATPEESVSAASCCGGSANGKSHGHEDHDQVPEAGRKTIDPVCGMTVDPTSSEHRFEHSGETYHFCSAGCRTKFAAAPESFLSKSLTHNEFV
ncbi:YHS domain-containing protein [Tardiphaga sp. vice304]|uniref:YHS domain-containing protein n=1 Tax=Tardiphaga sp. vice304 TaxID=2592817 RepID=UPI001165A3CB|nr:YHS domain-containing protein [Tardiphaga sp. vice304]